MKVYQQFKLDDELLDRGVWIEIWQGGETCAFRCRPAREDLNLDYARAFADFLKESQDVGKLASLAKEDQRRLMAYVTARAVVTDWRDVELEAGEGPAPFSAEACEKLFNDLPHLLNVVLQRAGRWAAFREKFEDEVRGN